MKDRKADTLFRAWPYEVPAAQTGHVAQQAAGANRAAMAKLPARKNGKNGMMATPHMPLTHCRRLFIHNYTTHMCLGVHAHEQKTPQRVHIQVDIFIPFAHSTPVSDHLSEVVDYDLIHAVLLQETTRGPVGLQETLCENIAQRLLAHPKIYAVRVCTEKPDAYPDCDSAGVEVFHIQHQDTEIA